MARGLPDPQVQEYIHIAITYKSRWRGRSIRPKEKSSQQRESSFPTEVGQIKWSGSQEERGLGLGRSISNTQMSRHTEHFTFLPKDRHGLCYMYALS